MKYSGTVLLDDETLSQQSVSSILQNNRHPWPAARENKANKKLLEIEGREDNTTDKHHHDGATCEVRRA